MYGFSLGVSQLPFIALFIGSFVGYLGICAWHRLVAESILKILVDHKLTSYPPRCIGGTGAASLTEPRDTSRPKSDYSLHSLGPSVFRSASFGEPVERLALAIVQISYSCMPTQVCLGKRPNSLDGPRCLHGHLRCGGFVLVQPHHKLSYRRITHRGRECFGFGTCPRASSAMQNLQLTHASYHRTIS